MKYNLKEKQNNKKEIKEEIINIEDDKKFQKLFKNFINELIKNKEDIPEEFSKIVNEYFWDLI